MSKSRVVGRLLRTTILTGAAVAVAVPALAQDDATDSDDEIFVTGSRIERTNLNGPTPVQVFDTEMIAEKGVTNVADLLFGVTTAGPGLFNENATLSQAAGVATFDNRGFGSGSTLILVNGRRVPTIPLGGSAASDVNSLPFAAIERVEFLNQGASAVYGSDAIGGVINVITRKDFDGLNLTGRFGTSEAGGFEAGNEVLLSGVGGVSSDRGSATISVEYRQRQEMGAGLRPLSGSAVAPDGTDGRSPYGFPGTWINFDDPDHPDGLAIPFDDCPAESYRPSQFVADGFDCAYDFAPLYQVVPYADSLKATGYFEYDVTDSVELFADIRLARTLTKVRNGAAPALFLVPGGAQGNPFATTSYAARRQVDAGPRSRDARNWTMSAAVGANWDINEDHTLSFYFQRSHVDLNQLGVGGNISTSGLSAAVAAGTFLLTEANTQEAIDAVSVTTFRDSLLDEDIINVALTGFLPFGGDLLADRIGYAIGAEYRDGEFDDQVDEVSKSGDVAGGAASNGGGGRYNYAAFAEISVIPIEMVELTAAARYDEIENYSGETADKLTYRFGGAITPTPWLVVRGSYGTGFKAPSLGQLYLGRSFGVTRAVDTLLCDAAQATPDPDDDANACRTLEIRSVSGGNPDLEPETSRDYGFGVVVQFDQLQDLGPISTARLQIDYQNVKIDNKVGTLSVQEILNNEGDYPELVNRVGGRLSSPQAFVRSDFQNLNSEQGKFLDMVFTADMETGGAGVLSLDLRANYLFEFLRQSSAIQPLCDDAGTTSEPKWRANGVLGWTNGVFGGNANVRYIGGTEDLTSGRLNGSCDSVLTPRPVDSYVELGLRAYWNVTETARVTFGVNNVADATPPFSETASGGWPFYDQALYSNIGRAYYIELSKDF